MAIKTTIDITDIKEAGFGMYLDRDLYKPLGLAGDMDMYRKGSMLVGGMFGSETKLELGSGYVVIDSERKQILINDGTTDRILIGYQAGGF